MENELQVYRITGMDCADCAKTLEAGVARLDGVSSCSLSYATAKLQVAGTVSPDDVIARVRKLGYDVGDNAPLEGETVDSSEQGWLARLPEHGVFGFIRFLFQRRNTALAAIAALLVIPGLIFAELFPMLGVSGPLLTVTSLAALVIAGYPIALSAWRSLVINHRITINLLMTIAAVGAVLIGAFAEAALVMVLFAIGEALEGYTMERARASIRSLMDVAPNEATVLRPCIDCKGHMGQDGYTGGPCPFCGLEEQQVPVASVQIGELVVVKPGDRIPMDGVIASGASAVNQAPITGESMPVNKSQGAEVFAGSINGEGALEVTVTRLAADNTITRIISMVEEAQERKAPAERFVDRFAQWYTPAVVVLAALVAIIPPLLFGAQFWGEQGWFYRALELLVIACPCALVISTPVVIISAISNAAHHGVLIKGGAYLEKLAEVKAIAFDKTGTLTAGQPSLFTVKAADCLNPGGECERCDDLLALASAVERRSEHPLAQAIVRAADARGFGNRYPAAAGVAALAGQGVTGAVNGKDVLIGSHSYFDSTISHTQEVCAEVSALARRGYTPMLVSENGEYRGYAVVADEIRTSSRTTVAKLEQVGVHTTVMLTGDNAATARAIAEQAGVSDVRAELMPEQKAQAVHALMDQYGAVAMVGDGVNDAPALASASVGIAMGAGTGQALETADVALIGNDLSKLPYVIRLSQAAMRTIRVNIGLSLGIKAVFLVLVLLGLGNLWMAVFADVGASLIVTLNGMRLLRFKEQV